jgi:RNA polymerase-binding transcription factor
VATIDKDKVAARLTEREDELKKERDQIRAADEGMREGELADYDQHPADQGTDTLEQEMDETTLMIIEDNLNTVQVARERLEQGKYGICIDCGEEIEPERLEAIPEAIRCLKDQNRYEGELRARGGRQ